MAEDIVLRKNAHRRLYDAGRRRFVKLSEVAEFVKAGATVGEISEVLRRAWGEHQETLTI